MTTKWTNLLHSRNGNAKDFLYLQAVKNMNYVVGLQSAKVVFPLVCASYLMSVCLCMHQSRRSSKSCLLHMNIAPKCCFKGA